MPYQRRILLFSLATAVVVAWPALVAAQSARGGGLFGATRSEASSGNRFNVTFSASESYETEVPAEFMGRLPESGLQSGGFSTMFVATADYANEGRRSELAGNVQSTLRYYQEVSEVAAVSHSATIGGRYELSRSTRVGLTQTAAYSPSYLYQLFPGIAPPELGDGIATAPEMRVDQTDSYSFATTASFDAGSVRTHRFRATAEYRHTDYQRLVASRTDLTMYTGRADYTRGLGRRASVSAGYEYRTGDFGFGPAVEQRITIGGEYAKPLTTSRRATFRFEISPSTLSIADTALLNELTGRVYRLQGSGSVEYQFRRTWQVGASYRRGVEYVPLLIAPVFADSARVELSGVITRRLDIAASAALANGESVLTRSTGQLDTYTATSRLRFALSRSFALYTEYLYYFYDLRGQARLAPGLAPSVEQHSVRAGVTVWVPLF